MSWDIEILPDAVQDLRHLEKSDQATIASHIDKRLSQNPTRESRNIKRLRQNPVAQYEMRVTGEFRVLYKASTERQTVTIIAVGQKIGNRLVVRGKEYRRHAAREPQ